MAPVEGVQAIVVEGKQTSGLTLAKCTFSSPLAPQGPCVVVRHALVDTGSSDCELRGWLLNRLPQLPVVSRGAVYETATGGEEFDAYEVLLTIEGRTAAVVVTACCEESSDDALLGHMALGALRLPVDCLARRLLPTLPPQLPPAPGPALAGKELRVVGPVQHARFPNSWAVNGMIDGDWLHQPSRHREDSQHMAPRWVQCNSCAVAITGPSGLAETTSAPPTMTPQGHPIIPVTYVRCLFRSPSNPHGPGVVVEQALVDTGSADCELREGFLHRIWPLPVVAQGVVYETVSGRVMHDSYEVLLTVGDRTCAAVVCSTPEERFSEEALDPNSDEAVVGFAALAALGLVVDCSARGVRPQGLWPPGA